MKEEELREIWSFFFFVVSSVGKEGGFIEKGDG